MSEGMAIGFVHSHRGLPAFFSAADDSNDNDVAELVRNRTKGRVDYVSIVVDETDGMVSRVFQPDGSEPLDSYQTATLGQAWSWRQNLEAERDYAAFERQILAFGPTFLQTLGEIRIGIVGAGATGSATAVLLARNGANNFVLIDPDHVEHSNLSRLHGATVSDAEDSAPKVDVLARHVCGFGLGVEVEMLQHSVCDAVARRFIKSCDLVFGCTDDHAGRLFLNRLAYFYNIPVIDMGIMIDPKRRTSGFITAADARVTVIGPGHACLLCRRVVDPIRARDEELARNDPEEFARRDVDGYVVGLNAPDPAVITLTTSVATMAVQELTARLTGFRRTVDHRVHKHQLMKSTNPEGQKSCVLCGDESNWGRGDTTPFLGRIG